MNRFAILQMKTILISGGTGLVGTRLTEHLLERDYNVVLLSRKCDLDKNSIFQKLQALFPDRLTCALWDPQQGAIDEAAIQTADAIINLAGAGIADQRWTEERKREIRNSRIESGNLICKSLREIPNNVQVVINASAIGYYGDDKLRPDETPFKEDATAANDFIGITCKLWEESIMPVKEELKKRLVILRTGIVLSHQGGMIPELTKTLNLRIASVFGTGHQIISWIHIDDLCEMYTAALEMEEMEGIYNAVVPFSCTNARLVFTLADKLHKGKFAKLSVPKTILKIALGEMSSELLKSSLVSSKKILDLGFSFQYPRIKDALEEIVRR